jgi:hypothetical protein
MLAIIYIGALADEREANQAFDKSQRKTLLTSATHNLPCKSHHNDMGLLQGQNKQWQYIKV